MSDAFYAAANGFDSVGFLSPELEGWKARVRDLYPAQFELAERVNRLAMLSNRGFPEGEFPLEHAVARNAYARAVQSFQCSVILAESGALADAKTLVRACAESTFVVAALFKPPAGASVLDLLQSDLANHKRRLANASLAQTPAPNEEDAARLRAVLEAIATKYPDGPKSLNYCTLASSAGLLRAYDLVYRGTSGDSAHTNLTSLDRHAQWDPDGSYVPTFQPQEKDLVQTLMFAIVSALTLLEVMFEPYGDAIPAELQAELGQCSALWTSLWN